MNISSFEPFNNQKCTLTTSQIDIWRFSLDYSFSNASQILDEEEKSRVVRFYFAKHQRRFTNARVLLRLILAKYTGLAANQLKFNYSKHGKPHLINASEVQFNLSHSEEMALIAVGKKFPLGIDLEFFSARPYYGIGDHLFSKEENQILKKLNQALLPLSFFHIWSQKEAFIKACGLGLSYPTQEISVPNLPPTDCIIKDPLTQKDWKLSSFTPQLNCCAALCYNPEVTLLRFFDIPLLKNFCPDDL